jgi:4-amino-4-deoxy-L-arabinose transferase-like glycosyltransferase
MERSEAGNHWRWFAIFWIGASTLLAGLGSSRLLDRDEPRNARCTIEMLEANDWVVPRFNNQLRTHKPILLYWAQMVSYRLAGTNSWGARLPSAIAALATVMLLGLWTRLLAGPSIGFWSAAVLATSLLFVIAGRAATPDALLILFATAGLLCMAMAMMHQREGTNRPAWFWLAYASWGVAMLAKGPVGLILPLAVALAWDWIERIRLSLAIDRLSTTGSLHASALQLARLAWGNGWSTLQMARLPSGLLIALAVATPWYLWVGYRTEGRWLSGFFLEHNLGRAVAAMEGHQGGLWFYPATLLAGIFPWSLFLLPIGWSVVWGWKDRSRTGSMVRLGTVWLLLYGAAFSLAATKLPSYLTPAYPGVACIVGVAMARWTRGEWNVPRWLDPVAIALLSLAGIAISAAAAYALVMQGWRDLAPYAAWGLVFPAAGLVAWAMTRHRTGGSPLATASLIPASTLVAASIWMAAIPIFLLPELDRRRSHLDRFLEASGYSDAVGRAHFPRNASPEPSTRWMAVGTIEPSWVLYSGHWIREVGSDENGLAEVARFLDQPDRRLVVPSDQWSGLERHLEASGIAIHAEARLEGFLRPNSSLIAAPTPDDSTRIGAEIALPRRH